MLALQQVLAEPRHGGRGPAPQGVCRRHAQRDESASAGPARGAGQYGPGPGMTLAAPQGILEPRRPTTEGQGGDATAPCRLAPHTCPPGRPRQQLGRSGSSGGGISRPVITPGTLLVWRRRQPAKFGHGPNNRGSRSVTGGACRHPCWRRTGQPARSRSRPEHRTQKGPRLVRPRTHHPPRPAGAGRTPRPRRRRPAPPALATRNCSATSSPCCAACQRWKGRSRTSSAGWRPQDGP